MHAVSQILEVLTCPVATLFVVSGGSPQSSSAAASVATAGRYRDHDQHHQRDGQRGEHGCGDHRCEQHSHDQGFQYVRAAGSRGLVVGVMRQRPAFHYLNANSQSLPATMPACLDGRLVPSNGRPPQHHYACHNSRQPFLPQPAKEHVSGMHDEEGGHNEEPMKNPG